jgi:hypothetical protein
MWNAWKRRHVHGFCGNTKEVDGLEDLSIYMWGIMYGVDVSGFG